jgi:hypothetical protein
MGVSKIERSDANVRVSGEFRSWSIKGSSFKKLGGRAWMDSGGTIGSKERRGESGLLEGTRYSLSGLILSKP